MKKLSIWKRKEKSAPNETDAKRKNQAAECICKNNIDDAYNVDDVSEKIENAILFEIYKRSENSCLFPSERLTFKGDELKKIVHDVCSENSYLDHGNATEEFFFHSIMKLYDDIALGCLNNPQAVFFPIMYERYVSHQLIGHEEHTMEKLHMPQR